VADEQRQGGQAAAGGSAPAGGSASPGLRMAYEHTVRALDRYAAVLAELRTRASIVLTATGIVGSTLGATALDHPHPLGPLIAGLAGLIGGIVACISVLWAIGDKAGRGRQWQVTLSGETVKGLADSGEDEEGVVRIVLDELTEARRLSYRTLATRNRRFQWAAWLLLGQILGWIAVLLY
jgi:hypothetical protein